MTGGQRPRVLLVDDHREILVAVQRLLTPTCEIVGAVDCGRLAIETASVLRPDVVVLDLNMPQVSGLDVCRDLVRCLPAVRVVILTAMADEWTEAEAYRLGASAFVRKIEMAERLPSIIQQLFEDETPSTFASSDQPH